MKRPNARGIDSSDLAEHSRTRSRYRRGAPSAINRLYYACFYAITAVLVLKGAKPRKHTAVRSAFNRDLVNSGVVPVDKAKVYNLLFDLRLAADYQDFFEANAESVRELSDESAELISILERHSHPLLD